MLRHMLKSKIHRATVTEANLQYEGSLSLCPALLEAAGMMLNEKVMIVNINNGARLETYLMPGKLGEVCLNGAAARLGQVGDKIIVMSFALLDEKELATFHPTKLLVDDNNAIAGTAD